MIEIGETSLEEYISSENYLNYPAKYRLAFRELGLAIGIKAFENDNKSPFFKYLTLANEIISFWENRDNQNNKIWQEHININSVMLATAILSDKYINYEELK